MSRSKWGPSTNLEIFLLQKCLHLKNLTPLTPARCGYLLYELIFFVVEIQYTFGFVCIIPCLQIILKHTILGATEQGHVGVIERFPIFILTRDKN